jgi:gamma-glutamyltranspeptidase/glutathione hydrolase
MVATSQPLAAEAGLSVLRDGGNAFDAAVATAAALNVVEPSSTGLGGDVFALYRTADGEIGGMQSCGGAPGDATIERVREAIAAETGETRDEVEMPESGAQTVTVPGSARGWEATVDRFGRFDLGTVLEPAVEFADEGYPVSEIVSHLWEDAEGRFTGDHARELYLPNGRAPRTGETVRLPALAESLRKIGAEGADVLYEGEIAERIVEEVQAHGGFLTVDDLASFEPRFVDPISTTYGGAEVYELPPNNQGLIALEALNVAEALGAGDFAYESPERAHHFAEAMKVAFHDGHHYITDPDYEDVPALTDERYAAERAAEIDETATADVTIGMPDSHGEHADTVLLCVADDEGNVVSYINSLYKCFGSGLVAGDTGIALQNRGASFSLDPDHPNSLEPGKRPFHTLIPALVGFGPDDWAAFGVMGGYMQPQGHVQVLSNIVDYGLPLQAALDAPRWRYLEDGTLAMDPRFDDDVLSKLARREHEVSVLPPWLFGGAQIVRNDGGTLSGATDPRKDGTVAGF